MSARTRARRRALELLFEAGQRSLAIDELVTMRSNDPEYPMKAYAVEIVEGITGRQAEIDEIISTYAQGWTLERMPAVDRALLEIGTWEILFNEEVPDKVAIDEALALAKTLCDDDSPAFIHGLLSAVCTAKNAAPAPESVTEEANEESSDSDAAASDPTDEGDVSDSSGASDEPAAPSAEIQPTVD